MGLGQTHSGAHGRYGLAGGRVGGSIYTCLTLPGRPHYPPRILLSPGLTPTCVLHRELHNRLQTS
ncbi:hypothetical protein E2C01_096187 [Portunus trituberculatus]|uniref:Uncharacterized protein n=1 Tax=Portunus trituberculatus TaxID=210409 RepID=A0A5B7K7L4_PORTR|nr:hypothetical protein [Portunus trituberculatus]